MIFLRIIIIIQRNGRFLQYINREGVKMTFFILGIIALFIYLTGMVALVQYKGDTSIANFTWGGGVMLVALYTFFTESKFLTRQIVMTSMLVLWASRLIIYVYRRYTGADARFRGWKWQGIQALCINSLWVYGQAFMIAIMSYPVIMINYQQVPEMTFTDRAGICLWIFGFCYESLSDYQLSQFFKDPAHRGHVMQSGLWRYSRHPNYFGEIVMWWSVYIIALSVPCGWTTVIAPATISFLLIGVTGVPLIEKALKDNSEYQEYKKRTSMIIPWF